MEQSLESKVEASFFEFVDRWGGSLGIPEAFLSNQPKSRTNL